MAADFLGVSLVVGWGAVTVVLVEATTVFVGSFAAKLVSEVLISLAVRGIGRRVVLLEPRPVAGVSEDLAAMPSTVDLVLCSFSGAVDAPPLETL